MQNTGLVYERLRYGERGYIQTYGNNQFKHAERQTNQLYVDILRYGTVL